MPFVKRDKQGRIVSVFHQPIGEGLEEVAHDSQELTEFLEVSSPEEAARREFIESDISLARVLEDLIGVLIDKGYIMFTDFPPMAQRKLLERRGLRKEFSYVENLFGSPDDEKLDEDGEGESYI